MLNYFRRGARMPTRQLQKAGNGPISLVDIKPFNVQLARLEAAPLEIYELTDIVTEWMNEHFEEQLENLNYASEDYAAFDTVILLERNRRLQDATTLQVGDLVTAEYKGAALFTKMVNQTSVPRDIVGFIQESTLANKTGLLERLQLSAAAGLGSLVVDCNTFIAESTSNGDGSGESLQMIIIIAVVVAVVAFVFLLLAVFWAWRYDRRNREAYLVKGRTTPTMSNSTLEKISPKSAAPVYEIGGESVIGGGVYPESVISEDISTSLSQYYRSSLASNQFPRSSNPLLDDAASVSSMESYGYSLDGYAPSTMTPMPGNAHLTGTNLPDSPARKAMNPDESADLEDGF